MKKASLLLFSLLLQAQLLCSQHTTQAGKRPNIIFILADDLGYADLPGYGNKFNEAPHILKLAKEGLQFNNAYAAGAVCSPTRASIMSGQYPARVGIIDFIPGHWRPFERLTVPKNRTQHLPLSINTIGEAMQAAGYATGYFGKWHLGSLAAYHPSQQGFEEATIFEGAKYYDFGKSLSPPAAVPPTTYLADYLTDLSLAFIRKNQKKPFFLFLSHYNVHVSLDADSALIQKYLHKKKVGDYPGNAVYAANLEQLDNSVGRIMAGLQKLGLDENTLVVFFSDNGGLQKRADNLSVLAPSKQAIYQNQELQYLATSNAPLREGKGALYEGGIRVPLIMRWPGKIQAGTRSQALVSSVDFLPTFAEIATGRLPAQQPVDGKSIVSAITGKSRNPHRTLYWHYPVYHHGIPASAVRQGDWKLIQFLDDKHLELYNLATDMGEKKNLVKTNPKKAADLLALLVQWRKQIKADMPSENPAFDLQKRQEWGKHPGS